MPSYHEALGVFDRQVIHERLIDLQNVDRELAQIIQRRIAGTEVVERDGDTHIGNFLEYFYRIINIGNHDRLRHFEFEVLRIDAGTWEWGVR